MLPATSFPPGIPTPRLLLLTPPLLSLYTCLLRVLRSMLIILTTRTIPFVLYVPRTATTGMAGCCCCCCCCCLMLTLRRRHDDGAYYGCYQHQHSCRRCHDHHFDHSSSACSSSSSSSSAALPPGFSVVLQRPVRPVMLPGVYANGDCFFSYTTVHETLGHKEACCIRLPGSIQVHCVTASTHEAPVLPPCTSAGETAGLT